MLLLLTHSYTHFCKSFNTAATFLHMIHMKGLYPTCRLIYQSSHGWESQRQKDPASMVITVFSKAMQRKQHEHRPDCANIAVSLLLNHHWAIHLSLPASRGSAALGWSSLSSFDWSETPVRERTNLPMKEKSLITTDLTDRGRCWDAFLTEWWDSALHLGPETSKSIQSSAQCRNVHTALLYQYQIGCYAITGQD